jgi:hypothetical protein
MTNAEEFVTKRSDFPSFRPRFDISFCDIKFLVLIEAAEKKPTFFFESQNPFILNEKPFLIRTYSPSRWAQSLL